MKIAPLNIFTNQNIQRTNKTGKYPSCPALKADTFTFCGEIPAPKLPFKNEGDEELCRKLIKKIYGEDCNLFVYREYCSPPRFDITHKNFYDEGTGRLLYDENDKLKYLSIQEYDLEGFRLADGHIRVYDMQGNLHKSLTPQQSDSIRAYRGNMATTLNYNLRYEHDVEYFRQHIKNIDEMFQNPGCYDLTAEDMMVYRGIKVNTYNENYFADKLEVGKIFLEKGFLSTTTDKHRVGNYGNFKFEIHVPKGVKYIDMTKITSPSEFFIKENEILFNRNTKLLPIAYNPQTQTFTMRMLQE